MLQMSDLGMLDTSTAGLNRRETTVMTTEGIGGLMTTTQENEPEEEYSDAFKMAGTMFQARLTPPVLIQLGDQYQLHEELEETKTISLLDRGHCPTNEVNDIRVTNVRWELSDSNQVKRMQTVSNKLV